MLSGLRNFFLVFLISLAGLGIGAYFLINYVEGMFNPEEMQPVTGDDGEIIPEYELDVLQTSEYYRITGLIIGIDNGDSQDPHIEEEEDKIKEADTIILVDINSRSNTFMLSYLPRDMQVNVAGYMLRLGAVYAEHDADMLIKTVKSYTGIQPDFYCILDYKSIEALFDILGEIEYDVPEDMYHLPLPYDFYEEKEEEEIKDDDDEEEDEPEIDLEAGLQMIDGEKAVQLLRYRGYGENYTEDESGRVNTHKNFIKEVIRQKLTLENLGMAHEIYNAVIECIVETDMTDEDFSNYINLIFGFSDFELKELEYPGDRQHSNGVDFLIPNHSHAVRYVYKEYKR